MGGIPETQIHGDLGVQENNHGVYVRKVRLHIKNPRKTVLLYNRSQRPRHIISVSLEMSAQRVYFASKKRIFSCSVSIRSASQ